MTERQYHFATNIVNVVIVHLKFFKENERASRSFDPLLSSNDLLVFLVESFRKGKDLMILNLKFTSMAYQTSRCDFAHNFECL